MTKKVKLDEAEEGEITESSGSGSGTESSSEVEEPEIPDPAAATLETGGKSVPSGILKLLLSHLSEGAPTFDPSLIKSS